MMKTFRQYSILMASLLVFMTGCATVPTQTFNEWGQERGGKWTPTASGNAAVRIETEPPGASLRADGRTIGESPGSVSLDYVIESRSLDRTLYKITVGPRPPHDPVDALDQLWNGQLIERQQVPLETETRTEQRIMDKSHLVSASKPGFFEKGIDISVPRDQGKTFSIRLAEKEELALIPVSVDRGIQARAPGPFSVLRNAIHGDAVSASDYSSLGQTVQRLMQAVLSDSGSFVRVSPGLIGEAKARLQIQVEVSRLEIVIGAQLTSPRYLHEREIYQTARVARGDLPSGLDQACRSLTTALLETYRASIP